LAFLSKPVCVDKQHKVMNDKFYDKKIPLTAYLLSITSVAGYLAGNYAKLPLLQSLEKTPSGQPINR
jgi:hypothetical protein